MSTTPEIEFDEWLATGTVAKVEVPLYKDKDSLIRYREAAKLLREYRQMVAQDTGERSIGEDDDELELKAAAEEAWEQVEQSRETWTLRALSADEIKAIDAAYQVSPMPRKLPDNAPAKSQTVQQNKMRAWADEAAAIRQAAAADTIVAAFVSIETSAGTVTSITAEQIQRMRALPGREPDITKLMAAITDATTNDEEPGTPFWREPSESDPA